MRRALSPQIGWAAQTPTILPRYSRPNPHNTSPLLPNPEIPASADQRAGARRPQSLQPRHGPRCPKPRPRTPKTPIPTPGQQPQTTSRKPRDWTPAGLGEVRAVPRDSGVAGGARTRARQHAGARILVSSVPAEDKERGHNVKAPRLYESACARERFGTTFPRRLCARRRTGDLGGPVSYRIADALAPIEEPLA